MNDEVRDILVSFFRYLWTIGYVESAGKWEPMAYGDDIDMDEFRQTLHGAIDDVGRWNTEFRRDLPLYMRS